MLLRSALRQESSLAAPTVKISVGLLRGSLPHCSLSLSRRRALTWSAPIASRATRRHFPVAALVDINRSAFAAIRALLLGTAIVTTSLTAVSTHAQESTWLVTNPISAENANFNDASNWTNGVPIGGIAFFGLTSNVTRQAPSLYDSVSLAQIEFEVLPSATATTSYTIGLGGSYLPSTTLELTGQGVTNLSIKANGFVIGSGGTLIFGSGSSGRTQDSVGPVLYTNNGGELDFDGSTAGIGGTQPDGLPNLTIQNNENGTIIFNNGDAGGAAINNNLGSVIFQNASTADSAAILNGSTSQGTSGTILFEGMSTAGTASFLNDTDSTITFTDTSDGGHASFVVNGGQVIFQDETNAEHATFTVNSGAILRFQSTSPTSTPTAGEAMITIESGGKLAFDPPPGTADNPTNGPDGPGVATAGNATIANYGMTDFYNSSTASTETASAEGPLPPATITTESGGVTQFHDESSAANAILINSGRLNFMDASTADTATITNAGTMVFSGTATAGTTLFAAEGPANAITTVNGGVTTFEGSSTGGSKTIITNDGGLTQFTESSNGDMARFITNSGGVIDISQLTAPGMTAGSIEGAGNYDLGSKQLTTGLNGLSTTVSGVISGLGGSLIKVGPTVTLTLSGANTYSGATVVEAGTLLAGATNTFSPNSVHTVDAGATLDLAGFDQTVAGVNNAGTIFTHGDPNTALTVNGNYVGQGGVLVLNTVLMSDNSPSDKLVINGGTATGTTGIKINRFSGDGAQTIANGILVVEAIDGATTSPKAFFPAVPIVAGTETYELVRGGFNPGSDPQDWFLRNVFVEPPPTPGKPEPEPLPPELPPPFTPDPPPAPLPPGVYPIIGPTFAAYGVVQPIARELGMTMLGTLHERIGDTLTAENVGAVPVGPIQSAWGRFFGEQIDNNYQAFAAPNANGRIFGFQAGLDLWRGSFIPEQRDAAGLYFAYGNANLNTSGLVTNAAATAYVRSPVGTLGLNGYSVGGYWTHYGPGNWYFDAVVQGTIYGGSADAQFSPQGINFTSNLPTDGSGVITSLEAGYPVAIPALGPRFVLEPQAQILWQHVGFNQAFDGLETVGLRTTSGVTGRLGIRGQWSIASVNDQVWQPYWRANFWRAWGGNAATSFGGSPNLVPLVEQATWGEIAAGVTFKYAQQLSYYAQFGYQFALTSNTGISGFKGDIGLRYTW